MRFALALLPLIGASSALRASENALLVRASGFKHARGHAIARLYQPGDDVLGPGRIELRSEIREGRAEFRFSDVPPGPHALMVFHDENDSGAIDVRLGHIPTEPLGCSNGFVPGFFAGKPTFDKLRFEHPRGLQTLDVVVK